MSNRAKRPTAESATAKRKSPALIWGISAVIIAAALAVYYVVNPGQNNSPPGPSGTPASSDTPQTSEPGLVTKIESLYNDIYLYQRADGNYMLSFGARRLRYVESIVNPNDELDLPVVYTQTMTAGLAYADKLESAAIIGLGGGRTAWYVHKSLPDLKFTAVELDPEVAGIADRYFSVRPEPNFDIAIRDGRVHLSRNEATFDMIMIDAYRGPFVPFHLLTKEFYELVARRLEPGGVVVQNVEPTTMLFDSAVATINAVFDHLDFFTGRNNIVIVAYNGEIKSTEELLAQAEQRQATHGFRYDLKEILSRQFSPERDDAAEPLTDDWAPVEYLKAVTRHNEKQT
jgi:spermidine synthase